jgi:glycosidase
MRKLLLPLLALAACQPAAKEAATLPCPPVAAPFTIKHPAWASTATLYQVNVRQYTPEGTFRAFEKHLARLDSMGVGIIWLMPVQPIGLKNRKGTLGSQYSVRDYRAVNPEFGTMADLKHLIDEAHRRKMHVILDWVANHTSWDNALITQHPDWYTRDAQGRLVPPVADWQDVVDLDYTKPALRQYMTESMAFWVKEAGFDGFRADVAGMVPTDFWDSTRAALERIKPVFLLAEWDELHDPPFLPKGTFTPHTHLLEKAFDSNYALRLHYLIDSIAQGQKTTAALPRYFADERRMYPAGIQLMNFTSSHDVNSWDNPESLRLGPNVQPLAVLVTLLPGIPMVYSGQEAASPRKLRFFDKDTIQWRGYPLQDFYTTLLHLKKRHPALAAYDPCTEFRLLPGPVGTVVFERKKDLEAVVVAINLTNQPQQVQLPATPGSLGRQYRDIFRNASQQVSNAGGLAYTLPAHGYQVWEQQAHQ